MDIIFTGESCYTQVCRPYNDIAVKTHYLVYRELCLVNVYVLISKAFACFLQQAYFLYL